MSWWVMTMKKLISAEQLADLLGLDKQTVLRLAREDRLPCYRVSRKTVRFDVAEVLQLLKRCAVR